MEGLEDWACCFFLGWPFLGMGEGLRVGWAWADSNLDRELEELSPGMGRTMDREEEAILSFGI